MDGTEIYMEMKVNKMKKIFAMFLVIITVFSALAFNLSAEELTGVVSDEGRLPFEDVAESHWFYCSVKFCYVNSVISGMGNYKFAWNGSLTRAQFITMLANLEGIDTSGYTVDRFTDIKLSHWYYGAVAWAYNEKIVSGMNENTVAPNKPLTRAELATVMLNYMQEKYDVEVRADVLDVFTDKPKESYWYYDAMKYAVSAGLMSGNSNGTIAPADPVTRAQAAVIFKSFMEKYYYGNCDHSFTEADCTNAPTCTLCGMVNDLPNGHVLKKYHCDRGGECLVCRATVEPSKLVHVFKDPTCTRGYVCRYCGYETGAALGHQIDNGLCGGCHDYVFQTPQNRLIYFLHERGFKNIPGIWHISSGTEINSRMCSVAMFYDVSEESLYFYYEHDTFNEFFCVYIDVTELTSRGYGIQCGYVDNISGEVSLFYGYIDPATLNISCVEYIGDLNYMLSEMKAVIPELLEHMHRDYYNETKHGDFSEFGFENY